MSNDISYNLVFEAPQKVLLMHVKSYLEDKKSRWDNRGEKTAADLLKETGLKHGAEIVTWGFQFGKIQENKGGRFSVEVTSWANENSLGNIWISGSEGELHFLLEKFPELEISGSFKGEFGQGCVDGSELNYESWNDDDEYRVVDSKLFTEELKFAELDSEQWKAACGKNQSLEPALASVHEPGYLIDVTLPQDVTIPFCFIAAGGFTMGSPEDEEGRDPESEKQVRVTLSNHFWLGQTEVTQAQWKSVMSSNLSYFKGLNLPVEWVSWDDTQAFIATLNQNKILPEGLEFALPTEAQWEYACRAGETGPYSGGTLDEVGWYESNSGRKTHKVGQKKPNAWGLYDMHGNVCEWCVDEFFHELKGGKDPVGSDPVGSDPKNNYRVQRGGSYCPYDAYDDATLIDHRAANRWLAAPSQRYANFGFRLAIIPLR
jgi:formylglycine-generating enzyme required for sulfatase activity